MIGPGKREAVHDPCDLGPLHGDHIDTGAYATGKLICLSKVKA